MTGKEFEKALRRVGLNPYRAAPFLGLSVRQLYRLTAGEYEAPVAAVKLLQVMARLKLTAEEVDAMS